MNRIMRGFVLFVWCLTATAQTPLTDCQNSLKQGDYAHARTICERSLQAVTKDSDEALGVLLSLIDIYQHLQNKPQLKQTIEQAFQHPAFASDTTAQYDWHRKVGQKYYFDADYVKAKEHLNQAFQLALDNNNPEWLSKSHNDMGLVELKLGDYKSALSHYQQSLKLKHQFGSDYQIARTLNNLGRIHLYLEQPDKAVSYYESALNYYLKYAESKDIDHRVFMDIAHLYEDLTKAYSAANNTQKAQYYALAISESLGTKNNTSEQVRALINLAQWHLDNGHLDVLYQLLTTAKALMDQNQTNPELLTQWYLLQAKMLHQNHQIPEALSAIENGLLISNDLNEDSLKIDLLYLKAELLEDQSPRQALQAFKQYQQLRSQFLQQKYDTDLKTVQHQIETQKIQQQLLNQELTNSRQQQKLHHLTNMILIAGMVLISMAAFMIFYQYKRKKEKQALIQSIRYHKHQLLMFQTTQKPELTVSTENHKEALKKALVESLIDATIIWEKTTQTSQIELAEQSKIWTVSIDNGTLRARSLEKYLSLEKIPDNPRWRNVVQTNHFILSQDNLQKQDRQILEKHIECIMDEVRALSLKS
ncbi:tetratricopeptide repeat protein [Marinicella pacifica]|uniref:tetratricopeptide repeat protein n=1 Tax=Marinicella pacifica TaxID=1171543 RepID=UPI001668C964|nr:tetratricopeptide repeat protein [Marinicella pacifica]